jgi:UDP-glucose 4-epimerase
MEKYGARSLVFSSSATVYGTPPEIPIKETSPIKPESVYGRTKAIVEAVIQDTCRATYDRADGDALRAVSVRYFK